MRICLMEGCIGGPRAGLEPEAGVQPPGWAARSAPEGAGSGVATSGWWYAPMAWASLAVKLGRPLLRALLLGCLGLLLALLGGTLALFARSGGIVGGLLKHDLWRKGRDEQSADIGGLNADARTGTHEPQIGPRVSSSPSPCSWQSDSVGRYSISSAMAIS